MCTCAELHNSTAALGLDFSTCLPMLHSKLLSVGILFFFILFIWPVALLHGLLFSTRIELRDNVTMGKIRVSICCKTGRVLA